MEPRCEFHALGLLALGDQPQSVIFTKSTTGEKLYVPLQVYTLIFLFLGSLLIGTFASAQTLVQNGSFETIGQSVPSGAYTSPFGPLVTNAVSNWTFGSSGGSAYAGIATATSGLLGNNIENGANVAFVQGTGSISQTVNLAPGSYTLSFYAMGRVQAGNGANPMNVSIGGLMSSTVTPTNTTQQSPSNWTLYSLPFTVATSGSYTLRFAGTIPYGSCSDYMTFIDNVYIGQPYNIVFIGDSITYGATLANPATQASSFQAAQSMNQFYALDVQMSNQGHPGHTTVDWQPSSSSGDFNGAVNAAASLQTNHPGQLIFSIMLGTNDSAQAGPTGAPVSVSNYLSNMRSIIDNLLFKYPNAIIVVNQPTWYSPNTQNSSLYGSAGLALLQTYFPDIVQLISDCATAHPGRVFAGDKQAFYDFQTNYLNELTPESGVQGTFYLHPNANGAIVLGEYWANKITQALNLPLE